MSLSGQQRKELQLALIDAFPNTASLEQMLSFELDKSLRAIAGEGNLQNIVFELIKTANAEGWVEDLLRGACNSNPGNSRLKAIAGQFLSNHDPETSSVSSPNIPQKQTNQQQKILILTAIPHGLRLDKEIREIEEAIRRSENRNLFDIRIITAVRPQDIRRAIAEEQPQIVHFCGHGLEDGSLLLEDEGGNNKPVSPEGLASLFKLHADYVNCVLLNACYSEKTAIAISQYINYVIGINQPIEDKAAIEFAKGFYDGLGYKISNNQDVFQRAFDEGMVAIEIEKLSQGSIPIFVKKSLTQYDMAQASELTNLVQKCRAQIKRQIEDHCGNIKILTMSKPVAINKIYVDLKIIDKDDSKRIKIPDPFEKEIKNNQLKVIVTGDIGSGKTTFLKRLAFSCIQGEILPEQLPLHIFLKEYTEADKSQNLFNFIANKYNLDKSCLDRILKDEKIDRCLLIFDGLDQIEETNREHLINKVKDFIDKYPNNDYIISCRKFSDKGLLEPFEEIKIEKLDKEQIENFIYKRFKVLSSTEDSQCNDSAEKLIEYLKNNENILKLCENPLMLALICLEYINKREEKLSRTETKWAIVREAVEIWLDKWNTEQGRKGQRAYNTYFVEKLLSFIAYKTFKDTYIYLSKERLIKYIQEFIIDSPLINYDAQHQLDTHAEKIFQALVDIYGITPTTDNDFYSFPHIIFRNYFAIFYIGRNCQSIDEFKETLRNAETTLGKCSIDWKELLEDADKVYNVLFGGTNKLDAARN
ncbi:NACHT domain-containing protein [Nostoc linckia FACHB-104]|nr:NACHT domain-containing protein [Nostoc linckia FACHB-104]